MPTASERLRTTAYHSGIDHPNSMRQPSTASFRAERSLPNTEARSTPPARVTRPSSRRAATWSATWLSTNPPTTTSKMRGPEREPGDVADDRVSPLTDPVPEHVRLQVQRHHHGAELAEQIADGARAGSRVQRPRARQPSVEPGHQVPGERDVGQRCVLGPRAGAAPVGATHRVRAHSSHRAPARAAEAHQASSSSSPTAFSQANVAMMPTRHRPSCRSHQSPVSTPRRSSPRR